MTTDNDRLMLPSQQRRSGLRRNGSGSVPVLRGAGPGLPTSGAVALALGAGVGGGAADVITGPGLRAVFAVAFVTGCVLAAAFVRRRGLVAAVAMPPLVYVVVALAAAALQAANGEGPSSWFLRQVFEMVTALMLGAPVMLVATGAATIVALVRYVAWAEPVRLLRHLSRGG